MLTLRETINHRHGRITSEFDDMRVLEYARHNCIHVTREHPRYIGDTFTLPQADFLWRKVKRMTTEL